MSTELQHVKRRIAMTRQIGKVTAAMQRVAAARLVNDRRAMDVSRRYGDRLGGVLANVLAAVPEAEVPLLARRPVRHALVVALGSDRGLCGGFNAAVVDAMEALVAGGADETAYRFLVIGKIVARRARRLGMAVDGQFEQPSRALRGDTVDALAAAATSAFLERRCDQVSVLYTEFVPGLVQTAVVRQLLPVLLQETEPRYAGGETAGKGAPVARRAMAVTFEPAAEDILSGLLPQWVRQSLDQALLSSIASENAARQVAMSRASENAAEILGDLRSKHRRLRQESITTEMLELAGGMMSPR